MTWTSFSELLLNGAFKGWFGFHPTSQFVCLMLPRYAGTNTFRVRDLERHQFIFEFCGEEPNSTPSSQSNTTAPLTDTESCIMSLIGRFWASLNVVPTVLYMMLLCIQVQTMTQSAVTCRYRLTMLMTKLGTSILLFWLATATLSTPFLDPR